MSQAESLWECDKGMVTAFFGFLFQTSQGVERVHFDQVNQVIGAALG